MKPLINKILFLSILLGLSACSTQQDLPPHRTLESAAPLVDAACNVTAASFAHIEDGHCPAGAHPHGDQFLVAFCTQVQQQTLCEDIQQHPANRVIQAGGRVCYDKDLGYEIGTAHQTRGRLVITSTADGTVVTQFPVVAGSNCPP